MQTGSKNWAKYRRRQYSYSSRLWQGWVSGKNGKYDRRASTKKIRQFPLDKELSDGSEWKRHYGWFEWN